MSKTIKTVTVDVEKCDKCPLCDHWRDHGASGYDCKPLKISVDDYVRRGVLPEICPLEDKSKGSIQRKAFDSEFLQVRKLLLPQEAITLLPLKDTIGIMRAAEFSVITYDLKKFELIEQLRSQTGTIWLLGKNAVRMKHGIATTDSRGVFFIETDMNLLREFDLK